VQQSKKIRIDKAFQGTAAACYIDRFLNRNDGNLFEYDLSVLA